jgi:hypothetical protein
VLEMRKFMVFAAVAAGALAVLSATSSTAVAATAAETVCVNGTQTTDSLNVILDGATQPAPEGFVLGAIAEGGAVFLVVEGNTRHFFTQGAYLAAGSPTPLTATFGITAGACVTPPAPPPGASHVFLCNTAFPSDANMILAAVSPEGLPQQNGSADNPAADAVATGQWFYPFSTGSGLLTCSMPAGKHLTGMTADELGNALPTDVVNSLHSNGDARTIVYPQLS